MPVSSYGRLKISIRLTCKQYPWPLCMKDGTEGDLPCVVVEVEARMQLVLLVTDSRFNGFI